MSLDNTATRRGSTAADCAAANGLGRDAIIEGLYRTYRSRLLRHFWRLHHPRDDLEDLVAEVFVRLCACDLALLRERPPTSLRGARSVPANKTLIATYPMTLLIASLTRSSAWLGAKISRLRSTSLKPSHLRAPKPSSSTVFMGSRRSRSPTCRASRLRRSKTTSPFQPQSSIRLISRPSKSDGRINLSE